MGCIFSVIISGILMDFLRFGCVFIDYGKLYSDSLFIFTGFLNWTFINFSKLMFLSVSPMSPTCIDIITIASLTCPVWTWLYITERTVFHFCLLPTLDGSALPQKDFRCILVMFSSCPEMKDFRSAGHWQRKAAEVMTSTRVSCLCFQGCKIKEEIIWQTALPFFSFLSLCLLQGIWELMFLPIWKSDSK